MLTQTSPGWCVAGVLIAAHAWAFEPDEVRIRVSVKRVLNAQGQPPTGRYGARDEIERVIGKCNTALAQSGAAWTLVLTEVVDTRAASSYYVMAAGELASLEADAKSQPDAFAWRANAINIYVVDALTDAGGVCSFPTVGPHREAIAINSQSILGGSEGWLHEMGHYFNLIHTHEGDAVADTLPDPVPPSPFDCAVHDENFLAGAVQLGANERDTFRGLHNIMGYHCDPLVLTPLQIVRMRRALMDYRRQVLEPVPEDQPPVSRTALPPEAAGGVLPFVDGGLSLLLDGTASDDGDGGRELSHRWTIVSGPAGGATLETRAQGWLRGCSGLGYGDEDDLTLLGDMEGEYLTVYLTRTFTVANPARLAALELDIAYDDGFAAYLNDVEVARRNLPAGAGVGTPATVSGDGRETIDLTPFLDRLAAGENRLSIEVHNARIDSSDFSAHPVLYARSTNGQEQTLIASRAVWYYAKGSAGAPPSDWTELAFDPGVSRARLRITRPGVYVIRHTVDDGLPPGNTHSSEVSFTVGTGVFLRGDCNGEGTVDVSDIVRVLLVLFSGAPPPACSDACDLDDDGALLITDAIFGLGYLFTGGPSPPHPFPAAGTDATLDALGCGE